MFKPREKQSSFFDASYICEKLIPQDSFYRKFREIVWPIVDDGQFVSMYCKDNGRPSISSALLAMATILQFHRNLSDREMERAWVTWGYTILLDLESVLGQGFQVGLLLGLQMLRQSRTFLVHSLQRALEEASGPALLLTFSLEIVITVG